MLREIKEFFRERKMLNIEEIAIHFKISESALVGMLDILVQKRFIKLMNFDCSSCSSSCASCVFSEHKDVYILDNKN